MTDHANTDDVPETSASVRVPNVRPGALSGLSYAPLMSQDDAQGPVDGPADPAAGDPLLYVGVGAQIVVPAGDLTDRLFWVAAPDEEEIRKAYADAVYEMYLASGADEGEVAILSGLLQRAVYERTVAVDGEAGETDGIGEAVNADTGEVTAPGDPLPPIEDTDGTVLVPADAVTVDALLAWVSDAEDGEEEAARARAVLAAEADREGGPRTTLTGPLETLLA